MQPIPNTPKVFYSDCMFTLHSNCAYSIVSQASNNVVSVKFTDKFVFKKKGCFIRRKSVRMTNTIFW